MAIGRMIGPAGRAESRDRREAGSDVVRMAVNNRNARVAMMRFVRPLNGEGDP